MKVTDEELHILQHSLGLTRGSEIYRNHFCTGEDSKNYKHCESLVKKGLMVMKMGWGPDAIFTVTEAGKEIATTEQESYPECGWRDVTSES